MEVNKPGQYTVSFAVGLAVFVTTFFALNFFGKRHLNALESEIKSEASRHLEKACGIIDQNLNRKLFLAKSLASFVQYDYGFTENQFNQFAKEIYKIADQELQSVQIIRDSLIQFNYPKVGNEKTEEINILKVNADRKLVTKSIRQLKPILIGPRKLIQGFEGLVYREPILVEMPNGKNRFWGFAAIVIRLDQIIDSSLLENLEKISIYSENPTMTQKGIFFGDTTILEKEFVKSSIHLPTKDWYFYYNIEDKMQLVKRNETLIFFSSILLAFIVALLSFKEAFNYIKVQLLNKQLQAQNEKISAQLQEKAMMVKEIHHRIKNHFQLFSSLNQMLLRDSKNREAKELIETINQRLLSLSKAYSQFDSLEKTENYMPEYIQSLVENLSLTQGLNIHFQLEVAKTYLPVKKTVVIGVLLNELITNSVKHAFEGQKARKVILIRLKEEKENWLLSYADNGIGLPDSYLDQAEKDSSSSGVQLIKLFIEQLEGKSIQYKLDQWKGLQIRFPKTNFPLTT